MIVLRLIALGRCSRGTSLAAHSRRKLRCRSATRGEGAGPSEVIAATCQSGRHPSTRRWWGGGRGGYTSAMVTRAWWWPRQPAERNAVLAAFGGWAVDAFDFMLYSLVVPTLIAAWGISRGQAGLIATSTLMCSAAGGWVAGALSDRVGRVRMLQVTIAWFAGLSLLAGFAQSYPQLLVVRALQGLGFGGEWAVGAALVAEVVAPAERGRAVGTVQSGWAVGWGAAAIAYAAAFSLLPAPLAWRALFWAGVLPALLVLAIRGRVAEPARRVAALGPSARPAPLGIFAPGLLRTTLLASLMASGMQGGYYAITTWLPTYLKTVRGLSVLDTSGYLLVIITGSFPGYLCAAWASDALGRRATFALFALGSLLVAVAYTLIPIGDRLMLVLGFPLGFCVSGNFSGVGPFFPAV